MVTINVDFEVFKELTARRATESMTENDVLRGLLDLNKRKGEEAPPAEFDVTNGATFKNVFFPEGTKFRGTYKGRTYTAEIKNGRRIDSDGEIRTSPSDAAVKITGKPWNGWHFWHCKRPNDGDWRVINNLR